MSVRKPILQLFYNEKNLAAPIIWASATMTIKNFIDVKNETSRLFKSEPSSFNLSKYFEFDLLRSKDLDEQQH